jgi:hypothetical protein
MQRESDVCEPVCKAGVLVHCSRRRRACYLVRNVCVCVCHLWRDQDHQQAKRISHQVHNFKKRLAGSTACNRCSLQGNGCGHELYLCTACVFACVSQCASGALEGPQFFCNPDDRCTTRYTAPVGCHGGIQHIQHTCDKETATWCWQADGGRKKVRSQSLGL